MKKALVLLFVIMLIPLRINAITKEDLLEYVNSKSVSSDQETYSYLQKYAVQFTRMINSKNLTEEELMKVYTELLKVDQIVEKYGVTKKSELSKIPEDEKEIVKNALYECVLIISNSKSIDDSETTSSIIVNADETVDIVIDGSIVDKIKLSDEKFNYVGLNRLYIYIIIVSYLIFIVTLIINIINRKKTNNLLISISIFSLLIGIIFSLFSPKIDKIISVTKLFKKIDTYQVNKKVLVNENHEIIEYPSYYTKYATLSIPNLSIEEDILFGDNNQILTNFIGHTTSSYMPGEGKTIIYSAHNYNVKNLEKINNNDKITVTTDYGEFIYNVTNIKVMKSNEYSLITLNPLKETLILYTCYPFNISLYGDKRFVVYATLEEEKWVVE